MCQFQVITPPAVVQGGTGMPSRARKQSAILLGICYRLSTPVSGASMVLVTEQSEVPQSVQLAAYLLHARWIGPPIQAAGFSIGLLPRAGSGLSILDVGRELLALFIFVVRLRRHAGCGDRVQDALPGENAGSVCESPLTESRRQAAR